MKKYIAALAFSVLASNAMAQQASQPVGPAVIAGFGTLAVSTSSILLSTATVGPNSTTFPGGNLPNRQIIVRNSTSSAGVLYVCPLGGTCSAAVGIPLAIGETKTLNVQAVAGILPAISVIAATTATAVSEW